jgi:hypothetical protein
MAKAQVTVVAFVSLPFSAAGVCSVRLLLLEKILTEAGSKDLW